MAMRFSSMNAIVTGAASGIGRASAAIFAEEGARLLLVDRDREMLLRVADDLRKMGSAVETIVGDLSLESTAVEIAERVRQMGSQIDVLVNCAGIDMNASLAETSAERWDEVMAVNVRSAFLVCKHVVGFLSARGGAIVNIASAAGISPIANHPAYNASKGALIAFTKSLALDLAPAIRANCVCPGAVDTPLLHSSMNQAADPAAARKAVEARYPLRRIAAVEEIARVAVFLASHEASYITGAVVPVDGGRTMH